MNIGFFTDTYFPQVSGVSTSVRLLRDELVRRGHKVIIFTTTDPDEQFEEGVVRLPSVPFFSFDDRRVAYAGFERCLKIAREYQLDLVHTHTEFSLGMAGRYVAMRMKLPLVHTYHTMYENYTHYIFKGKLLRPKHVQMISKLYCNHVDGVIAPSKMTEMKLREYGVTKPIASIATGVELPEVDGTARQQLREQWQMNDTDVVLLSLSRLSKEKNIAAVLEAYAKVVQQADNVKLVIVGDGPERSVLEEQARMLNISPLFVGEIEHEEVSRYYQAADLYVNASMSETQGLTYLEAFANRLPVIAKRNDYLDGIMTEPSFGKLYDDFNEFADVILTYLQQLQQGAFNKINPKDLRPLSAEYFAEKVETFYDEIVALHEQEATSVFDKMMHSVKDTVRDFMGGDDEDA